ncbi:hypothetical protein [Streptomyces sp. NPDC059564]
MSVALATGMHGNACQTVPGCPLRTVGVAAPSSFRSNGNGWD